MRTGAEPELQGGPDGVVGWSGEEGYSLLLEREGARFTRGRKRKEGVGEGAGGTWPTS